MLEAIYKEIDMFKYPKVFQCDNEYEFKSSVIKLLKKRNDDIKKKENTSKLTQLLGKL